jgi:type IV pilus assembly protein PilE
VSSVNEERTNMLERQRGITLIELMTVVVVIAILASIAVPSYRGYLIRAQRSDAKTALMQLQTAQEKFYIQNNAYTDQLTVAPPGGLGLSGESDRQFYALAVALTAGGQGYRATATPIAGRGQADDSKCTEYSITDSGQKDAVGSGGRDYCWK